MMKALLVKGKKLGLPLYFVVGPDNCSTNVHNIKSNLLEVEVTHIKTSKTGLR